GPGVFRFLLPDDPREEFASGPTNSAVRPRGAGAEPLAAFLRLDNARRDRVLLEQRSPLRGPPRFPVTLTPVQLVRHLGARKQRLGQPLRGVGLETTTDVHTRH